MRQCNISESDMSRCEFLNIKEKVKNGRDGRSALLKNMIISQFCDVVLKNQVHKSYCAV